MSQPIQSASKTVEASVLNDRYNKETVYRICALYDMLKSILDIKLQQLYFCLCFRHRIAHMEWLLDTPSSHGNCIDVFTLLGIEAVKDLFAEPDSGRCQDLLVDHYARAFPHGSWHAHHLPPTTLPMIDQTPARVAISRLPGVPVLDLDSLWEREILPERCGREQALIEFSMYLATYEGDEPSLLCGG